MTRVMVTGATTPIGRALVDTLLADSSTEVVMAVARKSDLPSSPPSDRRLHFESADLTRERDVRTLMQGPVRELQLDSIVHGALHRSAVDSGRKMHAMNVESTWSILARIAEHPTIRRLVYRSFAEVYSIDDYLPTLIDEDHPLEFSPRAPQRVRDRVEADLMVCARQGMCSASIAVLRCAEILAPNSGSQLWDYLRSSVCFRPAGYNPIVNVLSVQDAVRALLAALHSEAQGVFNIAGADTLPLSELVTAHRRRSVPMPGPLIGPLYRLRTGLLGTQFRYDLNRARFHFSGVMDGRRAQSVLGFEAQESALR